MREIKNSQEGCTFSGDSSFSGNFLTYSAGLGMDIGITKRLGFGIEANYTGGLPVLEIECNEYSNQEDITPGDYFVGLNLALRYHF